MMNSRATTARARMSHCSFLSCSSDGSCSSFSTKLSVLILTKPFALGSTASKSSQPRMHYEKIWKREEEGLQKGCLKFTVGSLVVARGVRSGCVA